MTMLVTWLFLKAIEWLEVARWWSLRLKARKVSFEDAISLDRAVRFRETPEADRALIDDLTGTFR
jgi:hypothetical protein